MNLVALVPAAGASRRMGRPKLVLSLGRETVIERVVSALRQGGAGTVLVVAPPDSAPGALELAAQARGRGALVVHCAAPTSDMRATFERGLTALWERGLVPCDGLVLTPGDAPGLTPEIVRLVVDRFAEDPSRMIVPIQEGRRGHPVAFPWAIASQVPGLPSGVGVNALRQAHAERVVFVEVAGPGAFADLDTPEDYRAWSGASS